MKCGYTTKRGNTGRKAGRDIESIWGYEQEEALALLDELIAYFEAKNTQLEFTDLTLAEVSDMVHDYKTKQAHEGKEGKEMRRKAQEDYPVVQVAEYTGMRDHEYDNTTSYGVIIAIEEYAKDNDLSFDEVWEEGMPFDKEFYAAVLSNMDNDIDVDMVQDLEEGETFDTKEYWGDAEIFLTFRNEGGRILVDCDGDMTFKCKF